MSAAKKPAPFSIAALSFEIGGDGAAPTELHILPVGPFRAQDGRPFDCIAWQLDAAIARRVIERAAAQKTDICVDFEHQTYFAKQNGRRAEAAGWIPRTLEWREGKGLFATDITWVGDTAELITSKRYRYQSALFVYDSASGEVLEIISVALTNTPALDDLDALVELARTYHQPEGETTVKPEEQLAALTVERDGLKTSVATLTAERDTLKTSVATLTAERDVAVAQVAVLTKEKTDLAAAGERAKHAELLAAALSDGRLTPAQKPWAEKQPLAALSEYLEASSPLALLSKQTDGKGEGANGLTAEEIAMCSRMGVDPKDFLATKNQK